MGMAQTSTSGCAMPQEAGRSSIGITGGRVSDGRLMNNDRAGAAKAAQNMDANTRRVMGVSCAE
jgi:hypothetical protein